MTRSILKTPTSTTTASISSAARSREDRNKETALYHAELLQQRKDVEALILASTEALLDFPLPTADPAHPSPKDANFVKNSLKPFRPSDYDSLIEERNIDKQCGYVLCPHPNRQEDTKARYRILQGGGKGQDAFKVVQKQFLERWCSDGCGKRALYIKVQLNEEPAWTKAGTSSGDIVLLEDTQGDKQDLNGTAALIAGLKTLDMNLGEEQIIENMKALAIERGDGNAPSRSFGLTEVNIQENRKASRKPPFTPEITHRDGESSGLHDSIEGYAPKIFSKKAEGKIGDDDEEDMMPTI
ncbi:hypothetical protein MMC28_003387 [Mycoblastus sanguinarius]|nr:hypothetical protein [Mycoblastus sanguinarius]